MKTKWIYCLGLGLLLTHCPAFGQNNYFTIDEEEKARVLVFDKDSKMPFDDPIVLPETVKYLNIIFEPLGEDSTFNFSVTGKVNLIYDDADTVLKTIPTVGYISYNQSSLLFEIPEWKHERKWARTCLYELEIFLTINILKTLGHANTYSEVLGEEPKLGYLNNATCRFHLIKSKHQWVPSN